MKANYKTQNTPQSIHRFGYLLIKNILRAILNEGEAPSCMLFPAAGNPSAAAEGCSIKVAINCPCQPMVDYMRT
jgi:hypothetical protein